MAPPSPMAIPVKGRDLIQFQAIVRPDSCVQTSTLAGRMGSVNVAVLEICGQSCPISDMQLATIRPGEPEIFLSLQGEGVSAGRPSVFVRLEPTDPASAGTLTVTIESGEGGSIQDRVVLRRAIVLLK